MHPAISSIIRSSTLKIEDKINVLTFSTHERYQSNMSDINANFWILENKNLKKWNTNYASLPINHFILKNIDKHTNVPLFMPFDLVLSQSKYNQFHFAKETAKYLNIPLISLEHTMIFDKTKNADELKKLHGDVNIFISDFSAKTWEPNYKYHVIEHGINSKIFNDKNFKRENIVLSVVNDWINRDYECGFTLWKNITKNIPVKVVGETPNLSKAAKNTDELVNHYNKALIFLNTSINSPIPTTLLEAMSCGCCVITTKNEMISKVIKNGENGFISNDPEELNNYINKALKDYDLCRKIGKNARDTIIKEFSIDNFTKRWNSILLNSLRK